jgi:hypothetical protein
MHAVEASLSVKAMSASCLPAGSNSQASTMHDRAATLIIPAPPVSPRLDARHSPNLLEVVTFVEAPLSMAAQEDRRRPL